MAQAGRPGLHVARHIPSHVPGHLPRPRLHLPTVPAGSTTTSRPSSLPMSYWWPSPRGEQDTTP